MAKCLVNVSYSVVLTVLSGFSVCTCCMLITDKEVIIMLVCENSGIYHYSDIEVYFVCVIYVYIWPPCDWNLAIEFAVCSEEHTHSHTRLTALFPGLPG